MVEAYLLADFKGPIGLRQLYATETFLDLF